ncbi:hypothetical protein EUZ85_29625 [Hahella sp. KA22]|nr:hypothetical protein ENC22_27040 [Hahella sp. KA22]QAY58020.1 hypothetical protein EUZ85_29625 [Hahella sp. KA22]
MRQMIVFRAVAAVIITNFSNQWHETLAILNKKERRVSESLIKALQDPAVYGHPVTQFQLVETHISWVILTGPYAYKIKKPMDFGFLNFTDLERRRFYCEEELRLNRRLAPEIYQGLVRITGSEAEPSIDGDGDVIEYAVKMKQFNPEDLLSKLPNDSDKLPRYLDALSQQLADFHMQESAVADGSCEFGDPEQVFAPVQQNFDQVRPMLSDPAELRQLEYIEGWAQSTYERLRPFLQSRKDKGFVRECHGDVHLGNVTLFEDKVTLFDCIEFNEDFRWTDVYNDLAFLMMDLEDRGMKHLSYRFLNKYLEITGDYVGAELLPFYKSYRAMVRCKVALFTLGAPGLSEEAKAEQVRKYRKYLELAESYMDVPTRFLLITHGVSGTGKSTITSRLLERLSAIRLRSDVERKRLFGFSNLDNTGASGSDQGIYNKDASIKTYTHLADTARALLHCGAAVIIDATFLRYDQRQQMEKVAEEEGVPFAVVDCRVPLDEIERRLNRRKEKNDDPAEADVEVMHKQLTRDEPFQEDELPHVLVVSTDSSEDIHTLTEKLVQRLGAA